MENEIVKVGRVISIGHLAPQNSVWARLKDVDTGAIHMFRVTAAHYHDPLAIYADPSLWLKDDAYIPYVGERENVRCDLSILHMYLTGARRVKAVTDCPQKKQKNGSNSQKLEYLD